MKASNASSAAALVSAIQMTPTGSHTNTFGSVRNRKGTHFVIRHETEKVELTRENPLAVRTIRQSVGDEDRISNADRVLAQPLCR
jgi:hypothetical protein